MKSYLPALLLFVALGAASAHAQGKGVDNQTDRIRDTSSDRAPANNGVKQDNGAGRGLDFGKERTPATPRLPNPNRFVARRDTVVNAVTELMSERKLVLDTAVSRPGEGIFISQPYRFVKGVVVAQTELNRYADLLQDNARGWSQGRYTIIVEVQPVDGVNTNVSINAKIEGRSDGAGGAEWVSLRTTGTAEQEFMRALIEKLGGSAPLPTVR